ncbi:MAG: SpoIIE family protein phosphatase [Bacteroidota bacterium]
MKKYTYFFILLFFLPCLFFAQLEIRDTSDFYQLIEIQKGDTNKKDDKGKRIGWWVERYSSKNLSGRRSFFYKKNSNIPKIKKLHDLTRDLYDLNTGPFKMGQIKNATFCDPNNNDEYSVQFYSNGKVSRISKFSVKQFGKIKNRSIFSSFGYSGGIVSFYPNGKISEIEYRNDKGETEYTTKFYFNGNIKVKVNYNEGKENGLLINYHQNGFVSKLSQVKKGLIDGYYLEFDSLGKLIRKEFFVKDSSYTGRIENKNTLSALVLLVNQENSAAFSKQQEIKNEMEIQKGRMDLDLQKSRLAELNEQRKQQDLMLEMKKKELEMSEMESGKKAAELKLFTQQRELQKKIIDEQIERLKLVEQNRFLTLEQKSRDSLIFVKDKNNLNQINELKNLELQKQNKLLESEKQIKKYFQIGMIATLLFLSLLGILFYRNIKGRQIIKKQNEQMTHQYDEIKLKNKEIVDSINYAKRIQFTLLAHNELLKNNLNEHFIYFNPKDIVSGDFYWATLRNNKFYLAVCDSTGHGVPGAFMSLLSIGFLNEAINEKNILKPNQVFDFVRKKLTETISRDGQKDGFDGILLCIDTIDNSLCYAAANNSPVLVSNNNLIELPSDRMPVGVGERNNDFTLNNVPSRKGDIIFLYTDGYADQFGGAKGKKFKYKQLNELLLSNSNLPVEAQKEVLKSTFENWKGNLEQVDDVCICGILF